MNRYDQYRSRGDRDGDEDREQRSERRYSQADAPSRGGFYPSAGYGFNPGEYQDGSRESQGGDYQGNDQSRNSSRHGRDIEYGQQDRERNRDFARGGSSDYGEQFAGRPAGQSGQNSGQYSGQNSDRYSGPFGAQYREQSGGRQRNERSTSQGNATAGGRYKPGPKGYKRSDERLCEDISERLASSGDVDSSEVSVRVNEGKVTLEGSVPERWMKHAIEDVADQCSGVQDVDNRIRVSRAGEMDAGSQAASGSKEARESSSPGMSASESGADGGSITSGASSPTSSNRSRGRES